MRRTGESLLVTELRWAENLADDVTITVTRNVKGRGAGWSSLKTEHGVVNLLETLL